MLKLVEDTKNSAVAVEAGGLIVKWQLIFYTIRYLPTGRQALRETCGRVGV